MPTRQMIVNFTAPLAKWEPSDRWVTRLLHRHPDELLTAWSTPMEAVRHHADTHDKYSKYFALLHHKIAERDILPENTYNMDEKGFMIGVSGRSVRVFDKLLYGLRQFKQSTDDGNRAWVTLVACICADGSHLPPGMIFEAAGHEVQASWVKDINPEDNNIHFTTSPTGWTTHDLGLAWLEQVFDRYTKAKARRRWRLLILDGHGSHVTRAFIEYCDNHRILLLIFPPHATHTLQPLDVVCFKPLSQNYSNEVEHRQFEARGNGSVTKADFVSLFWPAWVNTFTKSLVLKAFEATGIHPPNADVILDRFKTTTPPSPVTPPEQAEPAAVSSELDWLKTKTLLQSVVKDNRSPEAKALHQQVHHLHVHLELTRDELQGAINSINGRKSKRESRTI
jgi:hypothetical protein